MPRLPAGRARAELPARRRKRRDSRQWTLDEFLDERLRVEPLGPDLLASLEAGLGAGGASIDDVRHPDGVKGAFQDEFLVHSCEGEPCSVCGTPVRKFVAAGRGTYACEVCQPRPRARRRVG